VNPYALLGAGVLWIVSLVATAIWQNGAGHTAERVEWQAKENVALANANREIEKLRKSEQDSADRLASIGDQHAKEKEDLEAQRRRDVDAARSGALKLRVPGGCPASRQGEATATPGGSDDATTGELPGAVAAALLGLANDADEVVKQLAACQAVVMEDRRAP
jgi:hypothetical protein